MDKLKIFNEIVATIILFLCVCGAVVAFLIYSNTKNSEKVQHEYVYTILVDSTGVITKDCKAQIDTIVATIKEHEHAINDRYGYILEQRENSESYLTIGGIFVTIVLSVFGFFGYKSFKGIEEDVMAQAKKIAESIAEEISSDKATKVSASLNTKLSNKLLKEQAQAMENLKKIDVANTVTDAVQKIKQQIIEPKMDEITTNNSRIESLEKEVDELRKKLQEVVVQSHLAMHNRRTLSTTPGISNKEMKDLLEGKSTSEAKKEENV